MSIFNNADVLISRLDEIMVAVHSHTGKHTFISQDEDGEVILHFYDDGQDPDELRSQVKLALHSIGVTDFDSVFTRRAQGPGYKCHYPVLDHLDWWFSMTREELRGHAFNIDRICEVLVYSV